MFSSGFVEVFLQFCSFFSYLAKNVTMQLQAPSSIVGFNFGDFVQFRSKFLSVFSTHDLCCHFEVYSGGLKVGQTVGMKMGIKF